MNNKLIAAMLLALATTACNPPAAEAPKPEQKGREETRTIRNTENIGYSGDAIADKLDKSLDAADAHAQQIKDAEAAAQQ